MDAGVRRLRVGARRRVLTGSGVAAAALAFGVWCVRPGFAADPVTTALVLAVGVGYVTTGVLLHAEEEQRGNGRLFTVAGVLWLSNLAGLHRYGPFPVIGWLTGPLDELLLVVLLLRYPGPRLPDRLTRTVLAVAATFCVTLYVCFGLLLDPFPRGGRRTYWWPTLIRANDAARVVWWVFVVGAAATALVTVLLVVRRLRRSRGLERRELLPVLVAGGASAAGYVLLHTATLVGSAALQHAVWLAATGLMLTVPAALVATALRRRLDRAVVADLVLQVAQPATVGSVRDALRRVLVDPTLRVYVWLPDQQVYTDGTDIMAEVGGADRLRREVPDAHGGRLALVVADPALRRRGDVVDVAVRAAALSLENARLHAELLTQLGEVRHSRVRIIEMGVDQRRRFERDLHDGVQQRLLVLAATIGRAHTVATDPASRELIDQARAELRQALKELRDLARGIHPTVLEQMGLAAAVETVAEPLPLPVRVDLDTDWLPRTVESTVYFIICEALANVVKHADACRAAVTARCRDGVLRLVVDDDGRGGAVIIAGGGLAGLTDRVAALGGHLRVHSPMGAGTHLTVELPCGS